MLEDVDGGAGESEAEDEGGVVELVRDDQAVLVDEPRKIKAVGGEPHPEGNGVLSPDKFSNCRLKLVVKMKQGYNC